MSFKEHLNGQFFTAICGGNYVAGNIAVLSNIDLMVAGRSLSDLFSAMLPGQFCCYFSRVARLGDWIMRHTIVDILPLLAEQLVANNAASNGRKMARLDALLGF